jgi:hypothetical protein
MDQRSELEVRAIMLHLHAHNALTALATKHFLNTQFYGREEGERRRIYKTNVANTAPFRANSALIDTSIVGFVEHYRACHKGNLSPDIEELRKHRIVISHPANIKFSDGKVQEFYDNRRQYHDPTAIRIWRVSADTDQRLATLGSTTRLSPQIAVQLGTVEMIHASLASSVAAGLAAPPMVELDETVRSYFAKYEDAIKHQSVNEGGDV